MTSTNPPVRYRLSRFAVIRRDGETFVLESPRSRAHFRLTESCTLDVVAHLAQPRTTRELSARFPALSDAMASALVRLLDDLDLIGAVKDDESGAIAKEAEPPLESWEFHDLLFHARSRLGRHEYPSGATYRFRDTLPPLPARKPPMSESAIDLDRPDLERLLHQDAPFIQVAERRRSVRAYGEPPLTVRQLGEFLYRVGRVRSVSEPDPAAGRLYAMTSRPYPSGGAMYELELYLAAHRCEGLAPGLYHYDPFAHALERLSGPTGQVEALLSDASQSAHLAGPPQVLITMASRFQRRSWKYSGTAYANTLKNVGVLYQTMYLVATAMGMAPCALGAGDADLFAAAAGLDPDTETSVGEFLLGRLV